jgi:hypothetical protein
MCFLFACLHADLQILEIDILNTGADPGWGTPGAPPPKIGKKYDFLAWNRDFSHEIPQTFSRLPPLPQIF